MESIEKRTGRSFSELSFEDDDHIDAFCRRLGFIYSTHPQLDGSYDMSSSTKADTSDAELALWQDHLKL